MDLASHLLRLLDNPALRLAEALTTEATALAHAGRTQQSRAAFERAIEVAQRAGDSESAGVIALSMMEELSDALAASELVEIYERADDLLAGPQPPAIMARLRNAARRILFDHPPTVEVMTLADPWKGFSLTEEVRRIERYFIEQAIKEAGGSVSHAARLLGFKHHQSLNSRLASKHKSLRDQIVPVTPGKRRRPRRTSLRRGNR